MTIEGPTQPTGRRRHVSALLIVLGTFVVAACSPSQPQPSRSPTTQQPLSTPTSPPVTSRKPASPGTGLDLSMSAPDLRCTVVPDDPYWHADGLTIFVRVVKTGTGTLPGGTVPFRVASDAGRNRPGEATVSDDPAARTRMRIPLQRADYDATHVYTLTVDPDDEITELDETNNSLQVTLPRFDPPVTTSEVPCWTG